MVNEDILESLSSLFSNDIHAEYFRISIMRSMYFSDGQKVNSLSDVQLLIQNCTTVQCFVMHASYGVKAYQVNLPT